jgi:hypothetical protein
MPLIGAILAGYVYFASLYMQKVLGFSPVATGLALVPSTVTVVLVSTLGTRRLLARFSIRAVLLAGLACTGVGQLLLAQITAGASYPVALLPGLVLTAAGIGLALPTASIAITSGVQASDQGLAGPCSPPASRPAPRSGWRSSPPPPQRPPPLTAARWWTATGGRS